ncbi:DUF1120 domain-containing protein [Pseudomonas veronii]|jgi:type 1 fimbria pilin|uniref:DUF1120 domain-containing protein n=1 Tax=Pseudomonas veronii TaxID=76761 RepID=A0A0R3B5T4_PSEVE|nr:MULTISPECIES: DUF1120 domain-containing protein [Pseudomonas]SEB94095.1 Protein of unknown function [Pseudomonas marginalis]KRP80473.1 hypothetical protein TU80_08985 [Pseudomonas veronii]MBI6553117.1 DUF1120 domain-containing protein [Pseudomonas veronii]MBI6650540.1 DUF1120 domain-containing protein [Pseudomonas veronii]MCT8961554.1 DUF1120 domain-containing protein [Pseudomonas veronii]
MKKLLRTSVTGVLIGCAFPVLAASTVDLTVKGLIVPSACMPSLSAETIDVGRVSVKDLNLDTRTQLTPVTLQMGIDCEASTLFALTATDNRTDSANSIIEYGIGKTSAGQRIGGYLMFLDQGVADNTPVGMIRSSDNGTTWNSMRPDMGWQTNQLISIQEIGAARVPVPAQNTQVALSVKPFILPAQGLTITEDTVIDGSVTVEVLYL